MMSAAEIIESIKVSALDAEDLAQIMAAATTKLMANEFVKGGLDMMADPAIWGEPAKMPGPCSSVYYDSKCVRDAGHPHDGELQLHRDSKGGTW